jgi:hypothetical protein
MKGWYTPMENGSWGWDVRRGDQGKGNPIYKMGAQDMGMRKEGMRGG